MGVFGDYLSPATVRSVFFKSFRGQSEEMFLWNICWRGGRVSFLMATHTGAGVDADGTGDEGLSIVETDQHLQRSA